MGKGKKNNKSSNSNVGTSSSSSSGGDKKGDKKKKDNKASSSSGGNNKAISGDTKIDETFVVNHLGVDQEDAPELVKLLKGGKYKKLNDILRAKNSDRLERALNNVDVKGAYNEAILQFYEKNTQAKPAPGK